MEAAKCNNLSRGGSSLLLSVPHAGTHIPRMMAGRMNRIGLAQRDADHQVDRLYEWAPGLGVTMLVATHSRYVVDLNRPPDDAPLYPGAGTGLVPVETFAGEPIYPEGEEPDGAEIERRRAVYWQPYHRALEDEIERIRQQHGFALLLDAHSIASRVPRLFDGPLPDLNLGSNQGRSCANDLRDHAQSLMAGAPYSQVFDGRFKGGYITRHYGQPQRSVHALQMELSQACYLDETGGDWRDDAALRLQDFLKQFVLGLLDWRPSND